MLAVLFAMVVVMTVAALVLVYVAYPHRGQDVPRLPQVGRALTRAVDSMPVLTAVERTLDPRRHREPDHEPGSEPGSEPRSERDLRLTFTPESER